MAPSVMPVRAADTAVDDTPIPLVPGGVTSYTLAAPKVFWRTGVPQCPPGNAAADAPAAPTLDTFTESIRRIATYGSMERQLYGVERLCSNGQIDSNLAADATSLYWLQGKPDGGLYTLSTNANPGDPSQLVNALVPAPGEVVDGGDRVFYIANNLGGSNTEVGYVLKSNKQRVGLSNPGNFAADLSFDGKYM